MFQARQLFRNRGDGNVESFQQILAARGFETGARAACDGHACADIPQRQLHIVRVGRPAVNREIAMPAAVAASSKKIIAKANASLAFLRGGILHRTKLHSSAWRPTRW